CEGARLGRKTDPPRRQGAAALHALELDAQVLAQERGATAGQLELGTARADRDGVVTWVVPQDGATIPRGAPVARIATMSSRGAAAPARRPLRLRRRGHRLRRPRRGAAYGAAGTNCRRRRGHARR